MLEHLVPLKLVNIKLNMINKRQIVLNKKGVIKLTPFFYY